MRRSATLKGHLDLERHGGRIRPGVCARILQRILTLTAAIWHNETDGPVMALAHERTPDIAALAYELAEDGTLRSIAAADGTVCDALTELWPRLPS